MVLLDWIFVLGSLALVFGIGLYTQRYMKSVADFMSGGRLAGRYLLAVGKGEMMSGAVVFVAGFEIFSRAGFTITYWRWIEFLTLIIVAITGFVVYRFRETRAMTLAQFFEIRYSKRFRLVTGSLAFFAGILNFGIIPAVEARFFVYFLGLPPSVSMAGFEVDTFALVMIGLLGVLLLLTLSGGLITVMVTDCVEGMLSQVFFLVIIASLLLTFSWSQIAETLGNRASGMSMLNPYDSFQVEDFDLWYVLMALFVSVYGTMAWQNAGAYNAAAINPHESRMGAALGRWKELGRTGFVTLLAICAVTYLEHPHFAAGSAHVSAVMDGINEGQVRSQMRIPVALSELLPAGVKGIFCVVLLMGSFGGGSTHLHSWGGIFIQDVLVPLRKKPFTPKDHIRALRFSIAGVAVFAFLFGMLFRQTEYIAMWWQVTTAIYVGGAGAAIIGGLYWKKGTTAGAWAALLTGSTLAGGGILARQIWRHDFPWNGTEISFGATLAAITVYVIVSWLTSRQDYDMDRMLYRGAHALPPAKGEVGSKSIEIAPKPGFSWASLTGINHNFTRADKFISGGMVSWGLICSVLVLILTIWNAISPLPLAFWSRFWQIAGIGIPVGIAAVTAVWFTWGGLRDMRQLFARLKVQEVNDLDDGTVVNHHNLAEAASAEALLKAKKK